MMMLQCQIAVASLTRRVSDHVNLSVKCRSEEKAFVWRKLNFMWTHKVEQRRRHCEEDTVTPLLLIITDFTHHFFSVLPFFCRFFALI